MRVTFRTIHDGVASIDAAAAQFARAQEKVETGKRLQAPSDDPQAAMRIIQGKTEIGALDSYTRSGDTAGSRIAIMDTTFDDIVDKLTAAQSTTAAAMGSTVGPQQRAALAAALQGLRDGLVADLNVSFQGTYLFSGSETTTKPYEQVAGVWTYQGDQAPVMVEIGKGPISYRQVGENLFGRALQILKECYQPGADTGKVPLVHDGEEGGIVLSGRLEVTVDDERRILGPGDAYYFESRRPHRFRCVGPAPCEVISACTPPTF